MNMSSISNKELSLLKKQDTFLSFSKEAHFVGLETFLFNDVQPYTVEAMEKLEVLVFKKN
ncbi:hypothetical protein [Listeria riparia]|uniref:hypothetical protein n=1 Tax=Listeria riparia TaxID=1494964 RepID=UPI0004B0E914|nr:hypothetical protein [Listeria riparia]